MRRSFLIQWLLHLLITVLLPLVLIHMTVLSLYQNGLAAERRQSLSMIEAALLATAEISGVDAAILTEIVGTVGHATVSVHRNLAPADRHFIEVINPESSAISTCSIIDAERWLCLQTRHFPPPLWLWIPALVATLVFTMTMDRATRRVHRFIERHARDIAEDIDLAAERIVCAADTTDAPVVVRPRPRDFAAVDGAIARLEQTHLAQLADQMRIINEGRQSRQQKARVVAAMSHDLKGSLNSIIGFSELLLKGIEGPLSTGQHRIVSGMAEQSERLLVRIGDIVDTARFEAGRFELDLQWIAAVEILTDCVAGAKRIIGTRPITLDARIAPGLPPVRVDRERVFRAVLGLVAVATDALPDGEIRLSAHRKPAGGNLPRRIVVDIIDAGRRMPQDRRKELCDIFDSTEGLYERGDIGSVGLCMVLSRRIIRLHGGDVSAPSGDAAESPGCVFSIFLPLEDEPRAF